MASRRTGKNNLLPACVCVCVRAADDSQLDPRSVSRRAPKLICCGQIVCERNEMRVVCLVAALLIVNPLPPTRHRRQSQHPQTAVAPTAGSGKTSAGNFTLLHSLMPFHRQTTFFSFFHLQDGCFELLAFSQMAEGFESSRCGELRERSLSGEVVRRQ